MAEHEQPQSPPTPPIEHPILPSHYPSVLDANGTGQQTRLFHELGKAAIRNVSERSAPEFYDSSVPYIDAFSNAVECIDPIAVSVHETSKIPDWLVGDMFMLGPGMWDIEYLDRDSGDLKCCTMEYWNFGLAMIHRFSIAKTDLGTEITYRSRYLSRQLEEEVRHYGQNGSKSVVGNPNLLISSHLKRPDTVSALDATWGNCNIDFRLHFPIGRGFAHHPADVNSILCTSNNNMLQEIDPITLLPKRLFSYANLNDKFSGTAAVPKIVVDQQRGEAVHMTCELGLDTKYKIFAIADEDPFEPVGYVVSEMSAKPSLIHSFALTPNYVIVPAYPFKAGASNWRMALSKVDYMSKLEFNPADYTRFFVIDRQKRQVICVYKSLPVFGYTVINAFEDPATQSVFVDIACYDNDTIRHCFHMKNLRTAGMPPLPQTTVRRFCLAKLPDAARVYRLNPTNLPVASFSHRTEFPCEWASCNPRFNMLPYRYAYGVSMSADARDNANQIYNTLVKADLELKKYAEWRSEGCYPSAPTMIPRPGANAEDDGIVMSVVLNSMTRKSFVLLLDAASWSEIARLHLPHALPFTTRSQFACHQ